MTLISNENYNLTVEIHTIYIKVFYLNKSFQLKSDPRFESRLKMMILEKIFNFSLRI